MSRFFKIALVLALLGAGFYFGYKALSGGKDAAEGHGGMPPAQVSTLKVSAQDMPLTFEYVGQVSGSREVEVRARVTGIIEKRLYEEGQHVAQGTALFKIDPAPYAATFSIAEAGLAQAQARFNQAERDYKRLEPLAKTQAASGKEIDDAQSTFELAQAEVKSAQARLDQAKIDLGYTDVTAPISGVTGRALMVEGSLASAAGSSLLTTMAQTDPAHVHFSVPESLYLRLRQEIAEGRVTLSEGGMSVSLKTSEGTPLPHAGKVDFNDYKADPNTGSFAMRASVPNAEASLAPGQFVKVTLSGMTRNRIFTVPQRAVMESPAGKFVYLVGKGEKGGTVALPQPVKVGEWVRSANGENDWIVYEGLQDGAEVIIDGTARIFFPGAPVVVAPPAAAAPTGETP